MTDVLPLAQALARFAESIPDEEICELARRTLPKERPPEHADLVQEEREKFDSFLAAAFNFSGPCNTVRTIANMAAGDIETFGFSPCAPWQTQERNPLWERHYHNVWLKVENGHTLDDRLRDVIDRFLITFMNGGKLWGRRDPLGEPIEISASSLFGQSIKIDWGSGAITVDGVTLYGVRVAMPSAQGTVAGERRCKDHLVQLMANDSKREKPKAEYKAELRAKYKISARAFDRAWGNAIAETGNGNWEKGGRPPKPPHQNPRIGLIVQSI